MMLGQYHDDHYTTYYRDLAPSTVVGYEGDWRNYVEPEFANWEMEEIRVRHINAWLASDMFAGKPGAAESAYNLLRQMLRSAMGDELYDEDVVDPTTRGIRLPRKPWRGEPTHLGAREARELLLGLVGFEYEATAICGLWLGLRRSEQCGLRWGDIDLRSGITHVRRGLQVVGREVVVTDVKTHRSARPAMLPRTAVGRLREIKAEVRPKPGDWLLGDDPNPDRYARRLRAWCKARELPFVAPKYFRHTFRTLHADAGTPEGEVQKMLGHESLQTTYRYMALDEDVLREDQGRLEKLVLRA
ncbi:MAG: tyrosine-type recombinase/integrase [Eggerthellaceae bacterium]|nr:tyrosine-type recombinase/integrase [Eggerthellaceae bacterium]